MLCLYFQQERPQHEPCMLPGRDFCEQTTEKTQSPFLHAAFGEYLLFKYKEGSQ